MPAGRLRRRADCTTALALFLALGTACASKARTAHQPPPAPPPVAAAQPSTPATTTPPAAALPAPTTEPATPATQPVSPAAADPKMPAGRPADHVKDKHGVMHKRGYKQPSGDCTNCHGKDLRGQDKAPSCYQCHGKEWH